MLSNSGVAYISKCKKCEPIPDKCARCKKNSLPKDPVLGSPLIAAFSKPSFKKMFFMEKREDILKVLEDRLNIVRNKEDYKCIQWETKAGDSNTTIDAVLSEIKATGNYHILAFVDNQALDINWETIRKLCGLYCDIIINYPTSNAARAVGQVKSTRFKELNKIKEFFGCDITKIVPDANENKLLETYVTNLKLYGKAVYKIPVNTGISYHYDLLFVTKKSDKKTYERFIEGLRDNIKKVDAEQIKVALSIIKGRQATLFC